jgi:hypothetical protein
VFGKSITRPPKPKARRPVPLPEVPWRTFALALLAVLSSAYAIVRHYAAPAPIPAPSATEIPAPELLPVDR